MSKALQNGEVCHKSSQFNPMRTFKTSFLFGLLFIIPFALSAQGSAELEKAFTDKFGYKEKAMKKAPRKIFLREFSVYFQVLGSASDKSSGGGYRSTVVGATKTTMGVGLEGPSIEQLQALTDELYTEYTNELTANGFTFVSADEAEKTETYEDWTRFSGGGEPSAAQVGGYLAFTPSGADFFFRKQTAKGKKKGSVLIDNSHKLSRDLDDAIVAAVSLVVPFVELEAGTTIKLAQMGSKVKAKVKLELAANAMEQEATSGLMASFATPDQVSTYAKYTSGKGAGATSNSYVQHGLKKNVPINGVVESKKIIDRSKASRTSIGSSTASYNLAGYLMVNVEDREAKASHLVAVDADAYTNEVGNTLGAFLDKSLSSFLESAK